MVDNVFRGECYHVRPVRLMCSVFITKIMHKLSVLIFTSSCLPPELCHTSRLNSSLHRHRTKGVIIQLPFRFIPAETDFSIRWIRDIFQLKNGLDAELYRKQPFSTPAIETLWPVTHLQPRHNTDRDTQLPYHVHCRLNNRDSTDKPHLSWFWFQVMSPQSCLHLVTGHCGQQDRIIQYTKQGYEELLRDAVCSGTFRFYALRLSHTYVHLYNNSVRLIVLHWFYTQRGLTCTLKWTMYRLTSEGFQIRIETRIPTVLIVAFCGFFFRLLDNATVSLPQLDHTHLLHTE